MIQNGTEMESKRVPGSDFFADAPTLDFELILNNPPMKKLDFRGSGGVEQRPQIVKKANLKQRVQQYTKKSVLGRSGADLGAKREPKRERKGVKESVETFSRIMDSN